MSSPSPSGSPIGLALCLSQGHCQSCRSLRERRSQNILYILLEVCEGLAFAVSRDMNISLSTGFILLFHCCGWLCMRLKMSTPYRRGHRGETQHPL